MISYYTKLHQFRENIFKLGYVGSLGEVSIHPVTGDELLKVGRMYLGAEFRMEIQQLLVDSIELL